MKQLLVNEIYGPVLQGEGHYQGKPVIFIRTQFCPVGCGWCDSMYTWKMDKSKAMTDEVILERVKGLAGNIKHVVFTGGEPFAQKETTARVSNMLVDNGFFVEFETSGTYEPHELQGCDGGDYHFNISPKPPSAKAKIHTSEEFIEWAVQTYMVYDNVSFKFVVSNNEDMGWVAQFCEDHDIPAGAVYLMPEGRTRYEVRKNLLWLFENSWKHLPEATVRSRMHIELFDDKRSV